MAFEERSKHRHGIDHSCWNPKVQLICKSVDITITYFRENTEEHVKVWIVLTTGMMLS